MPTSFESHVTIEPVEGDRFDLFSKLCTENGFKPAHLLMMKNRQWTEERSDRDQFCTGHSANYPALEERTLQLVEDLKSRGFKVWRYKIEHTLLDVRMQRLVTVTESKNANLS